MSEVFMALSGNKRKMSDNNKSEWKND